ncbi:MAG: hypothetical protein U1E59_20060 [Amaricoccus sp.]
MDDNRIAAGLLALWGTGRQIARGQWPGLDFAQAYRVTARVAAARRGCGERPVGRKIGFTNTSIWPNYGVDSPMWNYVYDSTLRALGPDATLDPEGLPEPRIEPEIVLGLSAAPDPGMDEAALLGCIDWVAHGFEIVQSVYRDWRFSGPEAAAAFGLHGRLFVGPRQPIAGDRAAWGEALPRLRVTLLRDGAPVAEGRGSDVLGGPVSALRFLVAEIARHPANPPLAAGEIVTTGTLTDAQPVAPGETWSTRLEGVPLDGLTLPVARPAR